MRGQRLKFMLWLYNWSSKAYAELFKFNKEAWGIRKEEFLTYEEGSIGLALGKFYQEKGFDVMPKLENHDVFHVLTETGTEIRDEIAMQFLLYGNGKFSLYLVGMIMIGTLIFPEHLPHYLQAYRKGAGLSKFYHFEYKPLLSMQISEMQTYLQFQITILKHN